MNVKANKTMKEIKEAINKLTTKFEELSIETLEMTQVQ